MEGKPSYSGRGRQEYSYVKIDKGENIDRQVKKGQLHSTLDLCQ